MEEEKKNFEYTKLPRFVYVGLFFIAILPYLYLNGALQTAVDIALGSFSGRLESVNTSCFSGEECYAQIGSKKVALVVGWSKDQVGQIIGAESVAGLAGHIGENVEVFAKRLSLNKFTLVGNSRYFIRVAQKDSMF